MKFTEAKLEKKVYWAPCTGAIHACIGGKNQMPAK